MGVYDPFIDTKKSEHNFLAFADAVYTHRHDPAQGKMSAKTFAFLHDFMPRGFTG